MQLHFREYGEANAQDPVILLHGLFGSGINWHRIAGQLQQRYCVLVPDLRNHGRSPHDDDCSFPAMAADVLQLMDSLNISSAKLLGHSMGAKVAMWIALNHSSRCSALVSADMAPVAYPDGFSGLITLLADIPMDKLEHRADADDLLEAAGLEKQVRDYLLQNLLRDDHGWRWRINLQALKQGIDELMGFPLLTDDSSYPGPTLFISGGASSYVKPEHQSLIDQLFPQARMQVLPGIGHWVYAEDPGGFMAALDTIL